MLETIVRTFSNKSEDYKEQYHANRNLTNFYYFINSFFSNYDMSMFKSNHPHTRKEFRIESEKQADDYKIAEYKTKNCSIIILTTLHSSWSNGENKYRIFEEGKVEVNILSNHPSELKNMIGRLNCEIYNFDNPQPCKTCGISD